MTAIRNFFLMTILGLMVFTSENKTIRAQKLSFNGTALLWGNDGKLISGGVNDNVNPSIITNDENEPVIIWTSQTAFGAALFYAQKIDTESSSSNGQFFELKWNAPKKSIPGMGWKWHWLL